jgi:hypothetical protein
MRLSVIAFILICSSASTISTAQEARKTIPCKTPAIANSCYWAHGRLQFGNGTPALRLWKIGTRRVLGIYSGPSVYPPTRETDYLDNEDPQLPANVVRAFNKNRPAAGFLPLIFGNFEICPLESEKPQTMQAACIESAKNIVTGK